MSRVLFACFRRTKPENFSESNIQILSWRLQPDNISYPEPKIISTETEIVSVFNFNDSVKLKNTSVCVGNLISGTENLWWKPGGDVPDGTFAIFRSDKEKAEVLTDMVGTRTIWYYHDDNLFLSSTSQRAIVFFLKSFQFNPQALSWMLATGTLGPGYSWDKRIKMLGGDSILMLDRKTWELKMNSGDCKFKPVQRSRKEHTLQLNQSLKESFDSMQLDFSKWVLPLSGGYDSRAIFSLLKNEDELRCVTWGLESSLLDKENDAYIAKELADKYGKKHKYYLTDLSKEPVDKIFNRFLVCGEGRIGDIWGYLDGFSIWKELFEANVHGIIRGDIGFGGNPVMSEVDVRHHMRLPFFSDFTNLKEVHKFGIPIQAIPSWLNRNEEESLETWRDRINHQYEMPVAFAALNDLKLAYVEVINPLLSRKILSIVRTLPDKLRSNKKIFRKIVVKMEPDIKFAKNDATITPDNIFHNKRVLDEILHELRSSQTNQILPYEFKKYLIEKINLNKKNNTSITHRIKVLIKNALPSRAKNLLRSSVAHVSLDCNMLAFRAYMVSKMNQMLIEDSQANQVIKKN